MQDKPHIIVRILKNPITSILAMAVGAYLGFTNKPLSLSLSVYSEAYQMLLKMTVLPILISAVIASLGKFVGVPSLSRVRSKVFIYLVVAALIYATIGLIIGLVFRPGNLNEEDRKVISEQISLQSQVLEIGLSEVNTGKTLTESLEEYIPSNVFESLSQNKVLAILVFSVLFGFSIGSILSRKQKQIILHLFDEIYEVFSTIISYLITILPFALVCIISSEIAKSGIETIVSSKKIILLFYIFGLALFFTNNIILAISQKRSFFSTLRDISYPALIAFTTRNSVASMSVSIRTLENKFNLDKMFTRSTMPLLLVLGRFGNIFYFSLVTLFATQIYFINTGFSVLIFILFSIVLAGVASAGASGIVTLSVLGIILDPLGIPFETVLVILLIIDVIIDPLRTTLIVNTNSVLTALLHNVYKKQNMNGEQQNTSGADDAEEIETEEVTKQE